MWIKKVLKKLDARNQEFKKHPITKDARLKALARYVFFNTVNNFKSNIKYNWIENLSFHASKGDGGIVGNIYFGLYELNESLFLLHFLRSSDLFLDVGANIGHYSLLASGIKDCYSISIEPIPSTFRKLEQLIQLNKLQNKITTLNMGVGNVRTELFFSTDKNTMNRIVSQCYPNSIKIPVKTIDEQFVGCNFNVIKIDVEGYEKFVLEGSKTILQNQSLNVVIIEINFSNKFFNIENDEVATILIANDFQPYKYNPVTRELVELELYNKNQFNTIFIRDLNFVKERIKFSRKINIWSKSI